MSDPAPYAATIAALRALRAEVWDLDGCYSLDRLIDAATALNNAAPHWSDEFGKRTRKLGKHLRRAGLSIAAQYRRPSAELIEINAERDRADARSAAMREDA
jgi:hypothetical protein